MFLGNEVFRVPHCLIYKHDTHSSSHCGACQVWIREPSEKRATCDELMSTLGEEDLHVGVQPSALFAVHVCHIPRG